VLPASFPLPAPTGPAHLLVFGGSLGARIFNLNLPRVIAALFDAVPGLTVLHQTGARHFEATELAYVASGADRARWQVSAFLDDMPARFARAHLILSRSGATTVAEEAAAGKPALLVPFAAATDEHQRRNAEAMVQAGAAAMLEEKEVEEPETLLNTLVGLLKSPARLAAMAEAARTQAHPGAAEQIAAKLVELAGTQRS
jgi:UDP-N-acetylglucosamine--N-acetylmuramyl-(pentapeptide) pyrophosphoryl-undecaprenol N-acetylglucosamine transferase